MSFRMPHEMMQRTFAAIAIGGLVVGVGGAVGKGIARSNANKKLKQLEKENPIYKASELPGQRLALAKTLLNARTPGAASAERNIYANRANTIANNERGATSSNQLLLAGSAAQGMTDDSFNKLSAIENDDYQRRYENEVNAEMGMINEDDKVFADSQRRWQDKVGIQGAIAANRAATWGDVSNVGFQAANLGMTGMGGGFGASGGLGSLFKNTGKATKALNTSNQYSNGWGRNGSI